MDWEEWLEHMPCCSPFLVFSLSDRLHSIDYDLKVSLLRKSIGAWNIFFSSNHSTHTAVSQLTVCAPLDKTAETQVWVPVPGGDDRWEIRSKKRKFLPLFSYKFSVVEPHRPPGIPVRWDQSRGPNKGTPVGGLRRLLADHCCVCAFPKGGGASATPCVRGSLSGSRSGVDGSGEGSNVSLSDVILSSSFLSCRTGFR